jgi:thiaminase
MPHTVLYTSYMMRTVATRCHAEGLAVLLPCFWVYMHVGKCMLQLRKDLVDRYVRKNAALLSNYIRHFLCASYLESD